MDGCAASHRTACEALPRTGRACSNRKADTCERVARAILSDAACNLKQVKRWKSNEQIMGGRTSRLEAWLLQSCPTLLAQSGCKPGPGTSRQQSLSY